MLRLGISAFYHDSAACLERDGKIIAAAEEERFTEIKHDHSFPFNTIKWLLESNELSIEDIDEVCWYEVPELKKKRVIRSFNRHFFNTLSNRFRFRKEFKKNNPERILKKLGYNGPIVFTPHHISHAAFSYLTSPFKNAAIVSIDGVGELETVTICHGEDNKIKQLYSVEFPSSLGMLYSAVTAFLGFKPNEGEYKVMGLAPYGDAKRYSKQLLSIFSDTELVEMDMKYFDWEWSDRIMFNSNFMRLLDLPPRFPEEELTQEYKDLAASLQFVYEKKFMEIILKAKCLTKTDNLCLSGGSAYNGVANSLAYKYFKNIHIPFAPSDAGSAIGACLLRSLYKGNGRKENTKPYLGPEFTEEEILRELNRVGDKIKYVKYSDSVLTNKTAVSINDGKIVAWFQGRMEFGARALGNRSILASPSIADMREKLNYVIKKREGFRPFAPSVTEETAAQWFDIKEPVPYMNQVVRAHKIDGVYPFPAATHVNGTARVQTVTEEMNPLYYQLLKSLGTVSGAEVTLNTSFNLKDQTITIDPGQALDRFLDSEIDCLVIENYFIEKNE